MLALCTRVNEAFALDVARIAAYPSGWSYPDAFRYDERLLHPDVAPFLRARAQVGAQVLLAARATGSAFEREVYPIRFATVTSVDARSGLRVWFRLGRFVRRDEDGSLRDTALELPSPTSCLVLELDLGDQQAEHMSAHDDLSSWQRLSNTIGHESTIPTLPALKTAVFIHVDGIVDAHGLGAKIDRVYSSVRKGTVVGPCLVPGRRYEVAYEHRVPALVQYGSGPNEFLCSVKHEVGGSGFELDRPVEVLEAHYQQHSFVIQGKTQGAYAELVLRLDEAGRTNHALPSVAIPIKVRRSWTYAFRTWGVWLFLLALSLAGTSIYTMTTTAAISARGHFELANWVKTVGQPWVVAGALVFGFLTATVLLLRERLRP